MNTPFEIQAIDIDALGRRGSGQLKCLVNGYWSADCLTVYVTREWFFKAGEDNSFAWKVSFSHSSGGRQTDPTKERGVACDLEAAGNFGMAMIALAGAARQLQGRVAELEAAYQAQRIIDRAEDEARKAAAAAAVEADAAIGLESASSMVSEAVDRVRSSDTATEASVAITARPRGQQPTLYNTYTLLVCRARFSDKVTVRFNGTPMKRADAIAKFAELSAASVNVEPQKVS
jgi:hypothetical protein